MTWRVIATKDGKHWEVVARGYKIQSYANSLAWILVTTLHLYESAKVQQLP